tara:strand:+ start:84 stop:362 length:279 start_codon:yes stop_codon:yes gene_type:complete
MTTVAKVLAAADDSVTLINDINTNGSSSTYATGLSQEEINARVQRNVDHLETILAYAPVDNQDDKPDVAGSSEDKSSYTSAITTGKAYIAAN